MNSTTYTIYGAVKTTTLSTTVTAFEGSTSQVQYPNPPRTHATQYTLVPSPTDPASKYFPNPLPILVLTEIDAVVVNPAGQVLTTITSVQTAPTGDIVYQSNSSILKTSCRDWACWSAGKKAGVIIGAVLGFFLLVLVLVCCYCCCCRRGSRKKRRRDEELGKSQIRAVKRGSTKEKTGDSHLRRDAVHGRDERLRSSP